MAALLLFVPGLVLLFALTRPGSLAIGRSRPERARPAEVGVLGWVDGTEWRVVRPLARAETRHLLHHPAFLVGVAVTPLMLLAATSAPDEWMWARLVPAVALALVPLAWTIIVAADLLALRPRRTGADELFAAAPAPQPVRTASLLLTAVPATVVAAAVGAAWIAVLAVTKEPSGRVDWADAAAGPVLSAGAVAVGVAAARFLPHPAFGPAAAFAVAFIQARFFDLGAWPWDRTEADPVRFLGFLADAVTVHVADFEVRPTWWHLAYLVALVAVVAGLALARDGVPRWLGAALLAAVLVVAGTAWAQLRPPAEAHAAALVRRLTDPRSQQRCTTADRTTYCAYPTNEDRVAGWATAAATVRALLPPAVAARPLEVLDRVPTVAGNSDCSPRLLLESVHPDIARRLSPSAVWPADGAVHPGTESFPCGGRRVGGLFVAVQVGSWAVGLPPSPHGLDVRCDATGQGRAVVALWLGGTAAPGAVRNLREIADEHRPGPVSFAGWSDPPMFGARFHSADVDLAVALLARPQATVRAAIASAWDRIVDPATSSADVADLLGVAARGARPPADRSARCR